MSKTTARLLTVLRKKCQSTYLFRSADILKKSVRWKISKFRSENWIKYNDICSLPDTLGGHVLLAKKYIPNRSHLPYPSDINI